LPRHTDYQGGGKKVLIIGGAEVSGNRAGGFLELFKAAKKDAAPGGSMIQTDHHEFGVTVF
jgi:hypothetical protein